MSPETKMKLEKFGVYNLFPVEKLKMGLWLKRCDLFAPFGKGGVNGGKLVQALHLLSDVKERGYHRVLTGCSINSPQAPMAAAVCQALGMDCVVYYGCNESNLLKHPMPKLAAHFGASFKFCPSGRSNVLYSCIKKDANKTPNVIDYVVEYGMNSSNPSNLVAFYDTTAYQTKNLPEDLDNLIITCGSGITSAGILYGLKKYNKKVGKVYLMGNGPNRTKKIKERLNNLELHTGVLCRNAKFEYVDLFNDFDVKYETRVDCCLEHVKLHPNYEAKAGRWLKNTWLWNKNSVMEQNTMLWIIGAEPDEDSCRF